MSKYPHSFIDLYWPNLVQTSFNPLSTQFWLTEKSYVATFQEYLTKTAAKMLQCNPTSKLIEEVAADITEKLFIC